jgi:hypothetical protein
VDESLINGFIHADWAVLPGVDVIHFSIELGSRAPKPRSAVWVHHHSYRRRVTQRAMFDWAWHVLAIPFY